MKDSQQCSNKHRPAHVAGAEAAGGAVVLPSEQAEQMREHARKTYPEECCGILLGRRNHSQVICSVYPTSNCMTVRTHDRYEMDPREILRADRAAEKEGEEILGFYHSHPDHPPAPSPTDAEFAWPGYIYLIIAVKEGKETQIKAWTYDEPLKHFREHPIKRSGETKKTSAGICRKPVTTGR
ncbi:MAG: hypothetical protein GTN69_12045 [Armatimonadetes bacterium]|nr:hypothetical protein [Armatimonadota bacterium]